MVESSLFSVDPFFIQLFFLVMSKSNSNEAVKAARQSIGLFLLRKGQPWKQGKSSVSP
jgi:hypothetical protein